MHGLEGVYREGEAFTIWRYLWFRGVGFHVTRGLKLSHGEAQYPFSQPNWSSNSTLPNRKESNN